MGNEDSFRYGNIIFLSLLISLPVLSPDDPSIVTATSMIAIENVMATCTVTAEVVPNVVANVG